MFFLDPLLDLILCSCVLAFHGENMISRPLQNPAGFKMKFKIDHVELDYREPYLCKGTVALTGAQEPARTPQGSILNDLGLIQVFFKLGF